jgi:mRNA interferase MazF
MIRDDWDIGPGDLMLVQFGPVRGSEQDGVRPALVISTREMHSLSRQAFVCPITRDIKPWPTKVFLPEGLAAQGAVLSDQMRAIDRRERFVRKLGQAPETCVSEVRDRVAALLGIDFH